MAPLLFDTPGLSIAVPAKLPSGSPSSSSSAAKKRKRDSSASTSTPAASTGGGSEVNVEKLLKKLKGDSGWGGKLGSGQGKVDGAGAGGGGAKKKNKKSKAAGAGGGAGAGAEAKGGDNKPNRWQPAKKEKQPKKKKDFASSANRTPQAARQSQPSDSGDDDDDDQEGAEAATASPVKPFKHAAPTQADDDDEGAVAGPAQTEMQKALRAKLAGGRFRMLNEKLYTSTGAEGWETMKDEGAFDDYHAGFRGQAAHWPVHPLSLLITSLSSYTPKSLIVDFGCGDAALSQALVPKGLNVISFDLVSKSSWVVEAECSSVPLPGGKAGGEIVDVVVCCLSLMGTDWVNMVKEARRILRDGGELRIAEVTSRFTDVDGFVALIEKIGFESTSKDTSNTHFMMFDFVKTATSDADGMKASKRNEMVKTGEKLLKPCIYKKR